MGLLLGSGGWIRGEPPAHVRAGFPRALALILPAWHRSTDSRAAHRHGRRQPGRPVRSRKRPGTRRTRRSARPRALSRQARSPVSAGMLEQLVSPTQHARERPADPDPHVPERSLGEKAVKAHRVVDFGRRDLQDLGDLGHRLVRDAAQVLLHKVQGRQRDRPLAGVARKERSHLILQRLTQDRNAPIAAVVWVSAVMMSLQL